MSLSGLTQFHFSCTAAVWSRRDSSFGSNPISDARWRWNLFGGREWHHSCDLRLPTVFTNIPQSKNLHLRSRHLQMQWLLSIPQWFIIIITYVLEGGLSLCHRFSVRYNSFRHNCIHFFEVVVVGLILDSSVMKSAFLCVCVLALNQSEVVKLINAAAFTIIILLLLLVCSAQNTKNLTQLRATFGKK